MQAAVKSTINQDYSVWDAYWKNQSVFPDKDDAMCMFLALLIYQECHRLKQRGPTSAIELGAGSGRTSGYMNQFGAETAILDISTEALKLARFATSDLKNSMQYFMADLFQLSPELLGKEYEIAWNAGVLEHFSPKQQTELLVRMTSILEKNGLLVLLVPFAGSLFYRLGKALLTRGGWFPYGTEVPIYSLSPVLPAELELASRERSVGFLILVFNAFKAFSSVPYIGKGCAAISRRINPVWVKLLKNATTRRMLFSIDRGLSSVFGGYLLLSVCKRKADKIL